MPYFPIHIRKDYRVSKGDKKKLATLEQACGQVIIHHRERLGLSQMDLAVATGYSLRYVGDIERGTKSATLRTMNDLATLFSVHLGSLITDAEKLLSSKEKQAKPRPASKRKFLLRHI
ncbi:helix-turn-helix domain-containing protein [Granulicella sp. L60]|uniref:helix-turn-helix domain-containing protein n=1 Tax=Granulicella sp. L60 TaxID=1641866 RepID=UPI00131D804F|nr:helix-turn-helix transcriptional regulator [Granulicella sp. L60]